MRSVASRFAPHQELAEHLLQATLGEPMDAAHDVGHLLRVWGNAERLMAEEGGDRPVLTAATLLHDCVHVPKDSPLRSSASRMAAEKAAHVLDSLNWTAGDVEKVRHAIEAHSFSAGIVPTTLEAKILQDADRLDAIGHIGIARCFHVSGQMNRPICDPFDPGADRRALDDRAFAMDHFQTKLLTLSGSFQTATGRRLARVRHDKVQDFLNGLLEEILPDAVTVSQ